MTIEAGDQGSKPAVLVMAASRRGVDDPVALLQGKAHKCLVELDGRCEHAHRA